MMIKQLGSSNEGMAGSEINSKVNRHNMGRRAQAMSYKPQV